MEPFSALRSRAIPLVGANIDTDRILPARFLSKPRSGGFAQYLFHDLRFREDGSEDKNFVLNNQRYKDAQVLVCEDNFGCGSSRENAVWALADYGFRVVIAPSFGDIFYANCLKNGLLPVVLKAEVVAQIRTALSPTSNASIAVDLEAQTLTGPDGEVHSFAIDAFSRHCLLNGIDELDYTLAQMNLIDEFEQRQLKGAG